MRYLDRSRLTRRDCGLLAVVTAAICLLAIFAAPRVFPNRDFELRADFDHPSPIRTGSPVRVAGIDVGEVSKVSFDAADGHSEIAMRLKKSALPIYRDANARVRPRMFLEGNFFIDLKPGTPRQPRLASGDQLIRSQTSTAVALDEVLDVLRDGTREDLQAVVQSLGSGLTEKSSSGSREHSPISASEALNNALPDIGPALAALDKTGQGLLGSKPNSDLPRLIRDGARVSATLNRNRHSLVSLLSNMNRTFAVLSANSNHLAQTVALLPSTLENTNKALYRANAMFGPLRGFAHDLTPAMQEVPATVAAFKPWSEQIKELQSVNELGRSARNLRPTAANVAALTTGAPRLLSEVDKLAICLNKTVLPTSEMVIRDQFSTGEPNYKEFFYALSGMAGEGQNFDGNGHYLRFQTGGGAKTVAVAGKGKQGTLFGQALEQPSGTQPAYPGGPPRYREDVDCKLFKPAQLNAARRGNADGVNR